MIDFDVVFARGIMEGGGQIVHRFHTPKGNPLHGMWMRNGTNDLNVLLAASVQDEYELAEMDLSGVVIDIGAHIGAVSIPLLIDNPGLRVIAVEPVEANADLMWSSARDNGVQDRLTIIRGAVGAPGETVTRLHAMFRGNEPAVHHAFIGTTENGNEAVAENWRLGSDHDISEVPTYSYSDLREMAGETPCLVKIDCEGAEYAFLRDRAVDEVPLILGEWHNIPHGGRQRSDQADFAAMLPNHTVTFVEDKSRGFVPVEGPGGFVAVRK